MPSIKLVYILKQILSTSVQQNLPRGVGLVRKERKQMLLLQSKRCQSYCIYLMYQQQEQLKLALLKLCQTILGTEEDNDIALATLLLLDLDSPSFTQLIQHYGCSSLKDLKRILSDYYQRIRNEQILWQSEVIRRYEQDELIITTIFVLDLALDNKNTYIQSIISLGKEQQAVLQPFVEIITNREQFVTVRQQHEQEETSREHLMELADQNEKLKLEREFWMQKYQDMKENYDYLKSNHDKASEELNYLKQERFMLINELGGSQCGSVEETIDRVKREFDNYDKTIEKIQKELEEKKSALKLKIDELQRFEQAFKSNKYEQRAAQLEQLEVKMRQIERELADSKQRQEDLRVELCKADQLLVTKQEECSKLRQQIQTLQMYESKYLSIRKLHNQFKAKLVKSIKQID